MMASSPCTTALEKCLNLVRGDRDEQRLAGLLMATKLCNNDPDSIRKLYLAVGPSFLSRLLLTGMGKGNADTPETDNRDAYLHLCITLLAAFCRLPEIATSPDMLSKAPALLQLMHKQPTSSLLEECYEFLCLISSNSEEAVTMLYESGGLTLLAAQLPFLPDGSRILELALTLVQLIFTQISLETMMSTHLSELSSMVPPIARQFAILQNALKFDLLRVLCVILSSDHSVPLHNALRAKSNDRWPAYIRAGVVDILQNRVAPEQKLQALTVAESVVSIVGEKWLIDQLDVPDLHESYPSDRCLLLVLEFARVEIAVLLNELAYAKYEASSSKSEVLPLKRRDLGIAYSLLEKIIKLVSNIGDDEGEITFMKVISGLNETIGVVLEYLKDAKDHGQNKGDDLLASVRVAGSYLAQAPHACEDKVKELLNYLLSVEGENESRPFLSVGFMLPLLCQTTMKIEGVKDLVSSGAYIVVMDYLVLSIEQDPHLGEEHGCIFLACDTVMNLLLKREHLKVQLDEYAFVRVLKALAYWTDGTDDTSIIMMASSICSLMFESMSEESLLRFPDIDIGVLHKLSQLIARSLTVCGQDMCNDEISDADLHEIIASGYVRWGHRFPLVRQAVEN